MLRDVSSTDNLIGVGGTYPMKTGDADSTGNDHCCLHCYTGCIAWRCCDGGRSSGLLGAIRTGTDARTVVVLV